MTMSNADTNTDAISIDWRSVRPTPEGTTGAIRCDAEGVTVSWNAEEVWIRAERDRERAYDNAPVPRVVTICPDDADAFRWLLEACRLPPLPASFFDEWVLGG